MYYIIEHSPSGTAVVAQFLNKKEAEKKKRQLNKPYCDYYIAKTINNK